jgi:hypothetical protein
MRKRYYIVYGTDVVPVSRKRYLLQIRHIPLLDGGKI